GRSRRNEHDRRTCTLTGVLRVRMPAMCRSDGDGRCDVRRAEHRDGRRRLAEGGERSPWIVEQRGGPDGRHVEEMEMDGTEARERGAQELDELGVLDLDVDAALVPTRPGLGKCRGE